MRIPPGHIPKVALHWTPPGKRRPGRPKSTWCRTVETKLADMGFTWGKAQKNQRIKLCGEVSSLPYAPPGVTSLSKKASNLSTTAIELSVCVSVC